MAHGAAVEFAGGKGDECYGILVDGGEVGYAVLVGDADRLLQIAVWVGMLDIDNLCRGGYLEELQLEVVAPLALAGVENAAYRGVALALGGDADGAGECAIFVDGACAVDAYVVVFGRGDWGFHEVTPLGGANEVTLLLFGAAPQLTHVGHPGGVEHGELAITELHGTDAVVELVGGYAVNALTGHSHSGVGLETGGTQEGDEH